MSEDSSKTLAKRQPAQGVLVILYIIMAYIAATLFGGLALVAVNFIIGSPYGFTDSTVGQFIYFLLTYTFFVGVIVWLFSRWGFTRKDIGWTKPKWSDPLYAILTLPFYYIIYGVIVNAVSALFPSFNAEQSQSIGFAQAHSTFDLVLVFLSLAVIPPIAEEIITRGYLYAGLKRSWPKWLAVIGTSLVFAVGHLEFGSGGPLVWVAAVFTLVLSFMLIWLREVTGRLWAPIFLHALVNGTSFLFLFIIK